MSVNEHVRVDTGSSKVHLTNCVESVCATLHTTASGRSSV